MESSSTSLGDEKSLNKRLRELYPSVKEREGYASFPRRWDRNQASNHLDISKDGLSVTFKKHVKVPKEEKETSAVVRANAAIPASCGLYYFEVTIVHGQKGCMGVGLSRKGGLLNRMPGWDTDCYGYHGDDGNFFSACGHGAPYGPKFGTGDVVGCGIDTLMQHIFFTKNGQFLGLVVQSITVTRDLYPTVGLKTAGERLMVNFGQQPFVFDIHKHQKYLMKQKTMKIENLAMPEEMPNILNRIVSSFLATNGAVETLKIFEDITDVEKREDYSFIAKRTEIMKMIMNAENGIKIHTKINTYFPRMLDANPDVHVLIMCLRFIDLACSIKVSPREYRDYAERASTSSLSAPTIRRSDDSDEDMADPKLVKIDKDLFVSREMYVQLGNTDEVDKIKYLINMGRQIMRASNCIKVCAKSREIIELSLATIYSMRKNSDPHPLVEENRQFIANRVYSMLNETGKRKQYSELRGLFYGWEGLHRDMTSKDLQAASYSDAKHLVIDDDVETDNLSEMSSSNSRNDSPKNELDEEMPNLAEC
ncbi:unnamed protein product [Caenorhabditis angaria]|uniref:B30.2/SPRY domain-containing protein n=1 Tax=Caenorhabditis angaria TaxID=860376 RepID=A0A9P1I4S8_9PELO|nr:unnamed protein product [Caenorhabditis angaria]